MALPLHPTPVPFKLEAIGLAVGSLAAAGITPPLGPKTDDDRPFPGGVDYRIHLPGLYPCGTSSHPGGYITGFSGRHAA